MDANQMFAIEHGRRTVLAESLYRALSLPDHFHWDSINEDGNLAVVRGPRNRLTFRYQHTPLVTNEVAGADFSLAVERVSVEVEELTEDRWHIAPEQAIAVTVRGRDLQDSIRQLVTSCNRMAVMATPGTRNGVRHHAIFDDEEDTFNGFWIGEAHWVAPLNFQQSIGR